GSVRPGDRVVGDCVLPCYQCANCKDGKMPSACLNMREVGFMPNSPGGMGEYLILEEGFTHVIPKDWDFELGAWVETFNVGYWGVWGNGCAPDASDTCVIIGGGPIGLCAAITCKESSATVILLDPLASRRDTARRYGADHALDPAGPHLLETVSRLTDGRMADVVVECSGNDQGIASLFDLAGHSARVGLVGHSIGRKVPVEIGKTIWKTLRLAGSGGTDRWVPKTIRFLSKIRDKYDFAALNTHRFPFRDIHAAFAVACHDKETARKVMIRFD
ncbi:MAG: zinc-binding dehydrogenase, partial [Planctomycetes bacterium]|nr:zinc-binding dehydrogenase [Planctomycetota bacterium]